MEILPICVYIFYYVYIATLKLKKHFTKVVFLSNMSVNVFILTKIIAEKLKDVDNNRLPSFKLYIFLGISDFSLIFWEKKTKLFDEHT